MPTEHHDFIFLVCSGNLGDRVVRRPSFWIDPVHDVELELDRCAVGKDSGNASVVLVSQDDGWDRLGEVVRRVVECDDLTVLASRVVDTNERATLDEELIDLRSELACGDRAGLRRLLPASAALSAAALSRIGVGGIVRRLHVVLRAPLRGGGEIDRHESRSADQHDGALDLTLDAVEVRRQLLRRRLIRDHDVDGLAVDDAFRAWCPREHFQHERVFHRRSNRSPGQIVRPPGMAPVPRLEMRVLHAPAVHRLDGPLAGRLQVRRARHARAVDVREKVQRTHHLRSVDSLVADAGINLGIDTLFGRKGQCRRRQQHRHGERSGFHEWLPKANTPTRRREFRTP